MKRENNFIPLPEQEKKLYKARIVCSCGKEMGEKGGFEEEGKITTGSCEECIAKSRAELAKVRESLKNNSPEKE